MAGPAGEKQVFITGTVELAAESKELITGSAYRGSERNMANSTLQILLREPKTRLTDRATFAQALSRLSYPKDRRDQEEERKAARQAEEAA